MGLTTFHLLLEGSKELVLIHIQKQMVNSEIKMKVNKLYKMFKDYELLIKWLAKLFTNMILT